MSRFDTQAEEAASFCTSIFENSRVLDVARYGKAGPGPEGSVMTVDLELNGRRSSLSTVAPTGLNPRGRR